MRCRALTNVVHAIFVQESFSTQAVLVHVRGFIGQVAWYVMRRVFDCFQMLKYDWTGLRLV
jgi:hypothetical protein